MSPCTALNRRHGRRTESPLARSGRHDPRDSRRGRIDERSRDRSCKERPRAPREDRTTAPRPVRTDSVPSQSSLHGAVERFDPATIVNFCSRGSRPPFRLDWALVRSSRTPLNGWHRSDGDHGIDSVTRRGRVSTSRRRANPSLPGAQVGDNKASPSAVFRPVPSPGIVTMICRYRRVVDGIDRHGTAPSRSCTDRQDGPTGLGEPAGDRRARAGVAVWS